MKKISVFVLGPDRPGIIAAVSKTLFEQGCNLEDVSQTILQTEFMAIFIALMNDDKKEDTVLAALRAAVQPMGLFVHLDSIAKSGAGQQLQAEPFIITTIGPDRPGLVAGVTEVLASHGINITNLKAVSRAEHNLQNFVMIYEVDIPSAIDFPAFRSALYGRAQELGLDINLQHREIFEQIHRV
jgi:glycine cleavage system transcriptional repressor